MTLDESAKVLMIISANFPYYYKNIGKAQAHAITSTWQKSFSDVPAVLVIDALQRCIPMNKFPPTIAHVQEELERMYFSYICLENDVSISQEERSEAARISRTLYDLGFGEKGGRQYRQSKNLLSIGGINALLEG